LKNKDENGGAKRQQKYGRIDRINRVEKNKTRMRREKQK